MDTEQPKQPIDAYTSALAGVGATTLLPCPFCGGAAYRREVIEHYPASADGPAGSYSAWFHVGCDACGIEVGEEYESSAAALWNRRGDTAAYTASLAAENERLREALTMLLTAMNFRSACLAANAPADKLDFANQHVWNAEDAARKALK
jgi:hypothetical protein